MEHTKGPIKNIPDKIFLILGDPIEEDIHDFNQLDTEFVFWCTDRMFETDVEYVNEKQLSELRETVKELREALDGIIRVTDMGFEPGEKTMRNAHAALTRSKHLS